MFPDLCSRLLTCLYNHAFSLSEKTDHPIRANRENAYTLTPAQFCQLLRTEATAQAQVSALIFPQVKATNGSFALQPLGAELAAEKLAGTLFHANAMQKTTNFFRLGNTDRTDQATLGDSCLRLTSQVSCFDCYLGSDVYAEEPLATTFVGSLSQQA